MNCGGLPRPDPPAQLKWIPQSGDAPRAAGLPRMTSDGRSRAKTLPAKNSKPAARPSRGPGMKSRKRGENCSVKAGIVHLSPKKADQFCDPPIHNFRLLRTSSWPRSSAVRRFSNSATQGRPNLTHLVEPSEEVGDHVPRDRRGGRPARHHWAALASTSLAPSAAFRRADSTTSGRDAPDTRAFDRPSSAEARRRPFSSVRPLRCALHFQPVTPLLSC